MFSLLPSVCDSVFFNIRITLSLCCCCCSEEWQSEVKSLLLPKAVCVCVCVCVCVWGGDWMVNVHEGMLVCICMYVSVHLWAITAVLCCQQRERDSERDHERGESEREGERDDSQRCLWVPNSLRDSVTKYYLYYCRGALGTLRGWRKMTWGEDKQKESHSPLCGSLSPPGQMRSA